jgi:tRNA (cytidine/uridine-2'-O-)-methyltransferase
VSRRHVDIIEPTGFDMSDRNLKRAGMDYLELAALTRHVDSRTLILGAGGGRRLVLFTTKGAQPYTQFSFAADDILLFGRESSACLTMSMVAPMRAW